MTGNRFRKRAYECFKAAVELADPESKTAQLVLAQRWLRLADELDRVAAALIAPAFHSVEQSDRRLSVTAPTGDTPPPWRRGPSST